MTVLVLKPDGVVSSSGTVLVGAATINASMADGSDSSYTSVPGSSANWSVSLENPGVPGTALIKSVSYRLRCAVTAGAKTCPLTVSINGETWGDPGRYVDWTSPTTIAVTTVYGPTSGGRFTSANIDTATLYAQSSGTGVGSQLRTYEAYLDVLYVVKPVTAPSTTGTITNTNSPLIQWSNTLDSDGGSQTKYEVKIFSQAQYTAGGFDPATSLPLYTSGEISSSVAYYQTPGVLSNGLFRAYVRVAQTVDGTLHRSDWAYSTFTIAYVEPVVEDQRSHTAQVASPVFRRTSIKPLALDFSWSDGTSFLPWTINGNQYPPTVQKDGVSRPGTDANYAVVAASNNIAMTFTATAAMPAGTLIREYKWDWGDGQVGYGPVAVHEYKIASPETRVSLTITDSNGSSWSRSKLLNLKYANRSVVRVYEVRNP